MFLQLCVISRMHVTLNLAERVKTTNGVTRLVHLTKILVYDHS